MRLMKNKWLGVNNIILIHPSIYPTNQPSIHLGKRAKNQPSTSTPPTVSYELYELKSYATINHTPPPSHYQSAWRNIVDETAE